MTRKRRECHVLRTLLHAIAFVPVILLAALASSRLSFLHGSGEDFGLGLSEAFGVKVLGFLAIVLGSAYVVRLPPFEDARLYYTLTVFRATSWGLHRVHASLRRLPEFWGPVWAACVVLALPIGLVGAQRHTDLLVGAGFLNEIARHLNDAPIDQDSPSGARELVRQMESTHARSARVYPVTRRVVAALDVLHPDARGDNSADYLDRVKGALKALGPVEAPGTLEEFLPYGLRCKLLFAAYQRGRDPAYLRELDRMLAPSFDDGLVLPTERWQTSGQGAAREVVHNLLAGLHLYWATEYTAYSDCHLEAERLSRLGLVERAERYLVEAREFENLSRRAEDRICNNLADLLLVEVRIRLEAIAPGDLAAQGRIVREYRAEIRQRTRDLAAIARRSPERTYFTTLSQLASLAVIDRVAELDSPRLTGHGLQRVRATLEDDLLTLLRYVQMAITLGSPRQHLLGDNGLSELRMVMDLGGGVPLKDAGLPEVLDVYISHLEQMRTS